MSEKEIRTIPAAEIRAADDESAGRRLVGYAAVFNAMSEDLGGFREIIRPGAFAETIKADDIRALWNHDRNDVLGRTKNGTLRLHEDDHGLAFELDLPDTQAGRDAWTSTARGDVDQMSFGFIANVDNWINEAGAAVETIRELLAVGLFDISPVTFPAYPQTSAEARAMAESLQPADDDPPLDESDPAGEGAGTDAPDHKRQAALNDWRLRLSEME